MPLSGCLQRPERGITGAIDATMLLLIAAYAALIVLVPRSTD